MQGVIDRDHDGLDARAIGFSVAFGRTRAERLFSPETVLQKIMGAGPQEELKHACVFRLEAPDRKMGPGWLIKVEAFAPPGAALRHPGLPGALVLLIKLLPALLAGIRPHIAAVGGSLPLVGYLLTIEPLEFERLLGREADQDAAASPSTKYRRGALFVGLVVVPRSLVMIRSPLPSFSPQRHADIPVANHQNARHGQGQKSGSQPASFGIRPSDRATCLKP
ncbi:hypothetical protein ACU4GH_20195 [Bradyrhizobium betae]